MSFRFTTIDDPNALKTPGNGTEVFGISSKTGVITGLYDTAGGTEAGFADFLGNYTILPGPPGATSYLTTGVNNLTNYVGAAVDNGAHGYVNINGVFTTLDDPSAAALTLPFGINDSRTIVGYYADANSKFHAFTYANGTFFDVNIPGAVGGSTAFGINASGEITGGYVDAAGKTHGFLKNNNFIFTLDVPGAIGTTATGINDNGQIVGQYYDSSGSEHGFLYSGGVFTTFDDPRADPGSMMAWGINNAGVIVGTYQDPSHGVHGFVASRATPHDLYDVGTASVLWRSGSGLAAWEMNGSSIFSSGTVTYQGQALSPDASWSVVGTADFNADGMADMLWRQNTGALALWQMNNAGVTSSSVITYQGNAVAPDATWKIVEIGDFDGNGSSDILWRNDNGSMAEWLMNGSQVTASITPSSQGNPVSPDASWNVQGKPTMFV